MAPLPPLASVALVRGAGVAPAQVVVQTGAHTIGQSTFASALRSSGALLATSHQLVYYKE